MNVKLKVAADAAPLDDQPPIEPDVTSATASPDYRLEQELQELRQATTAELLDRPIAGDPTPF